MSAAVEPAGTLEVALNHATQLLRKNPSLAAEQALEILEAVPGHPHARLILGAARRQLGQDQAALEVLESLAREQPGSTPVHLELGIARGQAGNAAAAVSALRQAVRLSPESPDAWRLLADQLDILGEANAADAARARYLKAANKDPRLLEAGAALVDNNLPLADARLRAHLAMHPTDVAALRMLAEVAARLRRYADAQQLLERCLELAPSFDAARHNYAMVL
jgi:Flp pilus assembly protein TadD